MDKRATGCLNAIAMMAEKTTC